ncbi:hypothetical protein SCP_0203430 [Sparassis crispa]|uniref:BOD1/SHG1 domain-containing protein n=1 Tax=Sparassis crispa TaxID=139825 RepID=A0A401GAD2_9APHY|nr:hypothetical protein SCP_0203430 [Sparassis crispa]GBE79146.1 hypothetical protein SCP_0203430 [Sparassis crispa]
MAIINPTQLVDEFKKSGEFDRLRRELLSQFRNGEGIASFMARVEDITRQKLASDQKLQYMPDAAASRELMQELDRYPIVERAVADVAMLSDPVFATGIRDSVKKILSEDRKVTSEIAPQTDANAPDVFRKVGCQTSNQSPPIPAVEGESRREGMDAVRAVGGTAEHAPPAHEQEEMDANAALPP